MNWNWIICGLKLFPIIRSMIGIGLSLILIGESAFSTPGAMPAPAPSGFSFPLPASVGFVTDAYFPHRKVGGYVPDIILIRDLHVNRSVQFAISKILHRVKERGWLPSSIAIEGAIGPLSLQRIQHLFDPAFRKEASDYLVQQGEMRGDMHFAITEGHGDLYGIENPDTYRATLEMYRHSYEQRTALQRELNRLKEALKLLNHERNPQVRQNLALLNKDVEAVHQLVSQQVTRDELGSVIRQATVAIDHLKMVLDGTHNKISKCESRNGARCSFSLREKVAEPDEGLKKGLPLSPLTCPSGTLSHGEREFRDSYSKTLLEPLSAAVNFYVLALMRDEDLFKNLLQLRKADHQKTSVLVAGGFHSSGLTKQFKHDGLSYIVITPHVKSHTKIDERLYVERMLGHHLTLEQIRSGKDWAAMEMAAPTADAQLTLQQIKEFGRGGITRGQDSTQPVLRAVTQRFGFTPSGLTSGFRKGALQGKYVLMTMLLGIAVLLGMGMPDLMANPAEMGSSLASSTPAAQEVATQSSSSFSLTGDPLGDFLIVTIIAAVYYKIMRDIQLKADSTLRKMTISESLKQGSLSKIKWVGIPFILTIILRFSLSSPIDTIFAVLAAGLLVFIGYIFARHFGEVTKRNGPDDKNGGGNRLSAWLLIPLFGAGALLLASMGMPDLMANPAETATSLISSILEAPKANMVAQMPSSFFESLAQAFGSVNVSLVLKWVIGILSVIGVFRYWRTHYRSSTVYRITPTEKLGRLVAPLLNSVWVIFLTAYSEFFPSNFFAWGSALANALYLLFWEARPSTTKGGRVPGFYYVLTGLAQWGMGFGLTSPTDFILALLALGGLLNIGYGIRQIWWDRKGSLRNMKMIAFTALATSLIGLVGLSNPAKKPLAEMTDVSLETGLQTHTELVSQHSYLPWAIALSVVFIVMALLLSSAKNRAAIQAYVRSIRNRMANGNFRLSIPSPAELVRKAINGFGNADGYASDPVMHDSLRKNRQRIFGQMFVEGSA